MILQIPPIALSLVENRFTTPPHREFLGAILGYLPDSESLPSLLNWLDELDRGWLAVLRSQAWDPNERSGVELEIPIPTATGTSSDAPLTSAASSTKSVNQTDSARLRSIFVTGTSSLEEWLEKGLVVDGVDDLESALESLEIAASFR